MGQPTPKKEQDRDATQPAEEWGDRVETGRAIASGGKEDPANVPGATGDNAADPRAGNDPRKPKSSAAP